MLIIPLIVQVDAHYKLQDMKKLCTELGSKEKGYKKRLVDLQNDLARHLEQYVNLEKACSFCLGVCLI